MLRKLLKHEFRATARVMLPVYLVTILLALMTRGTAFWTEMVTMEGLTGQSFLLLISSLIGIGFSLALVATFVVAVIVMILRFRSNLMADEGYVMFTLPVSTHTLVWSKLIVSTVWFVGAILIDILSMTVLVADITFFQEFGRMIHELSQQMTTYMVGNGMAFLAELLLMFLLGCLTTCLTFYTPLAIGHSFSQHKMLLSVAFFFAIQVSMQIISGTLFLAGVPFINSFSVWFSNATPAAVLHGMMWVSILLSAIYGVVLYCLTIRMLHRHLNLE